MKKRGLSIFFENFLKKESIFKSKDYLQSNYFPETILHREEEIEHIAGILAPTLRMEKPSNLFIYGKTGTGKTLVIKHIKDHLMRIAKEKELNINIIYLNCKLKRTADTEYRLIAQIAREFGKEIPSTGLPTDEVYRLFIDCLKKKKQIVILILDEVDQLVKKIGDEVLYNLTRLSTEIKNVEISLVGISNNMLFVDNLDPRVKSSLSEEEILFNPYNALQLQDLLRVAAELAERKNEIKVVIEHLDLAEEKIERDKIVDIVKSQPKQFQLALYSILLASSKNETQIFTGEIYELYKKYCSKIGLRPLTQRRISDIIAELEIL